MVTANALEEEMAFSRHIVQQLLADLEDHIDRENLKKLLHYSKKIAAFQSRARYVKSAIDELLDSGKYSFCLFFRITALIFDQMRIFPQCILHRGRRDGHVRCTTMNSLSFYSRAS